MTKKKPLYYIILLATLLLTTHFATAQSKQAQIVVYGNGPDAYAAVIQSAMSNVGVTWLIPDNQLVPELTTRWTEIEGMYHLDAGIWAQLLANTLKHDKASDSVSTIAKSRINPQIMQNSIEETIAKYPHITIIHNAQLRLAKKSGKDWQIELSNKRRIKVRTAIDASSDATLFHLCMGENTTVTTKATIDTEYFQSSEFQPLTRTGVVVANLNQPAYTLPLATLIPANDHNIFLTRQIPTIQKLTTGTQEDIPLLMHTGQAIGAAAAYIAFYKTTIDKIDLRSVQGEILQYGARLVPFQDIPVEHTHFGAIQRIGATGLLPGDHKEGRYMFNPTKTVSTSEIASTMNQLFSRSQIWFTDHQTDTIRLADLLSLIKHISHRGNELEEHVKKNWKRVFAFDEAYDLNMPLTRLHITVLLDTYCKPFTVKVGLNGTIHR